jgi:hypothetical protein
MNAARSELIRGQYNAVSNTMNNLIREAGSSLTITQRCEIYGIQGVAASLAGSCVSMSSKERLCNFENARRFFREAAALMGADRNPSLAYARTLVDQAICELRIADFFGGKARQYEDAHRIIMHALAYYEHVHKGKYAEALIANGFRGYSKLLEDPAQARQLMQATDTELAKIGSRNEKSLGHPSQQPLSDWLYEARGIIREPAIVGQWTTFTVILNNGISRSFQVAPIK